MDAETPIQQKPINAGNNTASLIPQDFYKGDPLLVFVKDKLHLSNIWSPTLMFGITIAYNFSATTIFSQDYHPTASSLDALRLFLLSVAFTNFYLIYLLLPTFMAETFDTLRANGVIGECR